MPLLSLIVFMPLAGALVLMLTPAEQHNALRREAFIFSLVPFLLSLGLLGAFDPLNPGMQLTEKAAWIPRFGIFYSVGVDGISLFLVLLTTFLMPIVILEAWGGIHTRVKEYLVFLMFLETGMLGAFFAL